MSSGSVPGSTSGVVVRRNGHRTAENPVPRKNAIEILDEWTTAGTAAMFSTPGQEAARRALYQLTPLAHTLLQHCLRLEKVARRLEARVRERRRGNGWKATRQIELERQRLGRELHTGVGQMLAAVRLQMELISANLTDPPAVVRQGLEKISILVRDALEEVRSVSKRLHPPEWQRLTLESALRQLWGMSGVPESLPNRLPHRCASVRARSQPEGPHIPLPPGGAFERQPPFPREAGERQPASIRRTAGPCRG